MSDKINLHKATKANRLAVLSDLVEDALKDKKPWSIGATVTSDGSEEIIVDLGGRSKYKIIITEI